MTSARLAAYGRYQLADYVVQRALLPFAMIVLIAGVPRLGMSRGMNAAFWSTTSGSEFARQLYLSTVTLFLPLGAYFATAGVLSSDRERGYFRLLFSKPVPVTRYYLQQYLIHGATFIALFGALTWLWGAVTLHQPVLRALEAAALTWMLVGGLGFALGALIRFDGAVLALLYLVATAAQALAGAPAGPMGPSWITGLARILPPVHELDLTRNRLFDGLPLDAEPLWHVAGYGAGAWIIGWLALRLRALQR